MNGVGCRVADTIGLQTIARRCVAVHGRRVEVWTAPAATGGSLSVVGVRLAERVVAHLLAVPASSIRVAPLLPSGRPIALHAGADSECGVSISHLRRRFVGGSPAVDAGRVAAAACRGADIGIDLVSPLDISPAALARFLSADERATAADPHGAALVWAAKEAAFKAAGLDEGFRPRRVVIRRLTSRDFQWRARGAFCEIVGAGRFVLDDDHVLAIAVADGLAEHSVGGLTRHAVINQDVPVAADQPRSGKALLP